MNRLTIHPGLLVSLLEAHHDDPLGEQESGIERRLQVETLAAELQDLNIRTLALLADNCPEWVMIDLACQLTAVRLLPLPLYFTPEQVRHALVDSGCDALLCDRQQPLCDDLPDAFTATLKSGLMTARGWFLWQRPRLSCSVSLPGATQKITYTSGSTGAPKGVCLSLDQQLRTAQALFERIAIPKVRHLCVLPLSTLLENVAGVYAPLMSGGQILLPSLSELGFEGSSGFDVGRFCAVIDQTQPHSLILLPQMLAALLLMIDQGWQPPSSLRFVAVGGARVSAVQIEAARMAGLPVYEGYGLSECGSVVSLNTPADDKLGSAGQPLPHLGVAVSGGEILILGNTFLGYVGGAARDAQQPLLSGDLGALDEQGFVHLKGRSSHLLISSYGRNISPEWPESELLANPIITRAVVFGDARPYCVALLSVVSDEITDIQIEHWIRQVNDRLPDYAQVAHWSRFPTLLTASAGLFTANGRPRRDAIYSTYFKEVEAMYAIEDEVCNA